MTALEHLVVGVDGSQGARRALEWAAAQAGGGRLTVVHGFFPGLELLAAAAQINLDPVRAEHELLLDTTWTEPARAGGTKIRTVLVEDNPAAALIDVATRESADAIVIGHQGRGRWSRHHIGSVAGRLLHEYDLPLIMTSNSTKAETMVGTIVVGLSRPTGPDNPELVWALHLAERFDLKIHMLTVVEPTAYVNASYPDDVARIHTEFRLQMDNLFDQVRLEYPSARFTNEVRDGNATGELAAVASQRDACMVVVGTHQHGPQTGFFAGSVAHLLPPLLECPMAAVPATRPTEG